MADTVKISSSFVGEFKVGDNIVHNAHILCELAALKGDTFNKLIIIQAGALVEVCMSQIFYRADYFTNEGLPDISKADQTAIASKKTDKLTVMIDVMKKHKLLDGLGPAIYPDLHKLRKYRNKVHIQEDIRIVGAPRDEDKLFSADMRKWSLAVAVKVIEHISKTYPRPKHIKGHVADFELPTG